MIRKSFKQKTLGTKMAVTNAPEKIDWFTQTITDNSGGKTNWFQLDEYMRTLERSAKEENFLGFLNNQKVNDFFYHRTLKKHSEQLRHNLQTVWGCWIEMYNEEEEEINRLEQEIHNSAGDIEFIKQFDTKMALHSSTEQVYRSFGIPTRKALVSIKMKDWKGLDKALKSAYNFDMTYI
jgi:hypothetical protein